MYTISYRLRALDWLSGRPPPSARSAPVRGDAMGRIAMRTLRFEPGYVLLAGGCAALGWLTLFLYAVWGSDGAVFTRL